MTTPETATVEVTQAAREALFKVEMARTHFVQPVNGSHDYFYVSFAGQRIEFRMSEDVDALRGPIGQEMAALSDKAARAATSINDLLFDLAKHAAAAARHRTRATRQDGLREAALRKAIGWFDDYADQHTAKGTEEGRKKAVTNQLRAAELRAALSDSSTREESGADEALKEQEFNRGVLIAVSTLINCWGRGTETEHLLAMINATPEMVEQMGFDNYDREPLLAALSASPEGEG
jgi:hypothetical protein